MFQKALAARALGRIGELDRYNVLGTHLDRQLASGQLRSCVVAGQLLQGALGSTDASYRSECSTLLERHACGRDSEQAVMAILASCELAEADLALVMRVLRAALDAWLFACLDDLDNLASRLAAVERYFRAQEAVRWRGNEPRRLQDLAMYLVPALFSRPEFEVFRALKVALAQLCATRACCEVMVELAGWVGDGGKHSRGGLTALLFLDFFGIAEGLGGNDSLARKQDTANDQPPLGADLLRWLAAPRPGLGAALAKFFDGAHRQLAQYPALLHHALRQRWAAVLLGWADLAAAGDPARPLVVELLSRLLPTATPRLSAVGHEVANLLQVLQASADAAKAALARDVLAFSPAVQPRRKAAPAGAREASEQCDAATS